MKLSKGTWAIIIILLILLADQVLKIWIKTHFQVESVSNYRGEVWVSYEDVQLTNWFHIRFVENNGMAMGIEVMNKIFLTLFRIVASIAIIYYLYALIKRKYKLGYIICVSLIFAGAVGNIVDSVFYGVIFSSPVEIHQTAVLFPPGGGYSTWFQGKVVDMFYFPLFEFNWPSWVPFIGGDRFEFFHYIFNIADASISVGIIILIAFYRKTFSKSFEKKKIEN